MIYYFLIIIFPNEIIVLQLRLKKKKVYQTYAALWTLWFGNFFKKNGSFKRKGSRLLTYMIKNQYIHVYKM